MESYVILCLFVSLALSIPLTGALWKGLKFTPTGQNCPEDVKNVERNIRSVKIFTTITTVLNLIAIVFAALI